MGSSQRRRVAALVFAFAVVLGACGGGGSTSDPVGSVQSALDAISAGGFGKLADFACAAKKNDLANALGNTGIDTFTKAGISQADVFAAISTKFSNLTITQTAKTDTTATVHVTGNSVTTFDKDKMRPIVKALLASQGQQVTDAMVDAALTAVSTQLTNAQTLNQTVNLVNEGGKWLVCGGS